jgi:dipeptidyl-peptidase-4
MLANKLDAAHPYAPYAASHAQPEFGTLSAADGQQLHYSMLKPRNLVAGKRYPVLVDVYGGPGVQRVMNAWGNLFHQYLAQHGYIVFALDNRGSGLRGTKFETSLGLRMGGIEVQDQTAGVTYLRSLPFVDPQRIGIYGWSYGGYMAAMALVKAPDTFKAAVAGAPVTSWDGYDTHYTERYMGTPADNPKGYASSSVLTHVDALKGHLLIVHGLIDENVHFRHSARLIDALVKARKPYELLLFPDERHMPRAEADRVYMEDRIVEFFRRTL